MSTVYKFQPAQLANGVLPYPVVADEDGYITNLPGYVRVVGFAGDADRQVVDVYWADLAAPEDAVGMHAILTTIMGDTVSLTTPVNRAEARVLS